MSFISNVKRSDADGNIMRTVNKSKGHFRVYRSIAELKNAGFRLPGPDDIIRMVSPINGWNAASLVGVMAEEDVIDTLHISTFRVGTQETKLLENLYLQKRILNLTILTHRTQTENRVKLGRQELMHAAERQGWTIFPSSNHSKLILAKMANGKHYVVETSANMNGLPNTEFFVVSDGLETYDFYMRYVFKVLMEGNV
jgi:hypothetical protein